MDCDMDIRISDDPKFEDRKKQLKELLSRLHEVFEVAEAAENEERCRQFERMTISD